MKERDYILATNLARLRMAASVLREVYTGEGYPQRSTAQEATDARLRALSATLELIELHERVVVSK